MNEPNHFDRVLHHMRGRTKGDDAIEEVFQAKEAEGRHLLQDGVRRVRTGDVDDLRLLSVLQEFGVQPLDDVPAAPVHERNA